MWSRKEGRGEKGKLGRGEEKREKEAVSLTVYFLKETRHVSLSCPLEDFSFSVGS